MMRMLQAFIRLDAAALSFQARAAIRVMSRALHTPPPTNAALSPPLTVRAGVDPGLPSQPQEPQPRPLAGQQRRGTRERPPKPPPPPRPTHFLALPLARHASVTATIHEVQDAVVRHSPHMRGACVDAASAHLTLGVMALSSAAEREAAAAALLELAPVLQERGLLAPLQLAFGGLSSFRDRVLYLDVEGGASAAGGGDATAGAGGSAAQGGRTSAAASQEGPVDKPASGARSTDCDGSPEDAAGSVHAAAGPAPTLDELGSSNRAGSERKLGDCSDGGRERLMALASVVRAHFAERQLLQQADSEFAPHVTIAKTSKLMGQWGGRGRRHGKRGRGQPHRRGGGKRGRHDGRQGAEEAGMASQPPASQQEGQGEEEGQGREEGQQQPEQPDKPRLDYRRIPHEAYAALAAISCSGAVAVAELQLCAMQGRKPGAYYPVVASLPLGPEALLPEQWQAAGGDAAGAGAEQAPAPAAERGAEPAVERAAAPAAEVAGVEGEPAAAQAAGAAEPAA